MPVCLQFQGHIVHHGAAYGDDMIGLGFLFHINIKTTRNQN
jgi:hypothetical protein